MLVEESIWIRQIIELGFDFQGLIIVNLGSSTAHFREVVQPHIYENILFPVISNGGIFLNQDLKASQGVDLPGDIFDESVQAVLAEYQADLLICSNMLEHLEDPSRFIRALSEIMDRGSSIIVTVPFIYPYHPDPIDNYLRPSPTDLADMFDDFEVIQSAVVKSSNSYFKSISRHGLLGFLKLVVRIMLPVRGLHAWIQEWIYLPSIFTHFSVSCVLLRRK